jgi:hypothetical protein
MRVVVTMILAVMLGSCTSVPSERDAMCNELAEFANTVPTSAAGAVRLTTDWSFRVSPEDPDQLDFATRSCQHGDLDAGRRLCRYLVENVSVEFASNNYRRALRCLGRRTPPDPSSKRKLPKTYTSAKVLGVRLRNEVTVSYFPGAVDKLPEMTISTKALQ